MTGKRPDHIGRSPESRARNSLAQRASWENPEIRARRIAASKAALAARGKGRNYNVAVPRWVPTDLRDEYRQVGGEFDEFFAAKHLRMLLAEMRREGVMPASTRQRCSPSLQ